VIAKMESEIEINGQKYIARAVVEKDWTHNKEVEKKLRARGTPRTNLKSVDRFSTSEERKFHKQLGKFMTEEIDCISETYALNMEECCVVDRANVCMIVAKTERARLILRRYMNVEIEKESKEVKLDYEMPKDVLTSKYSSTYLHHAMLFMSALNIKSHDESVIIKLKKDFPITIESKDFKFILAPRAHGD
jgi:hypothetical protein